MTSVWELPLLRELLEAPVPTHLWHYTSAAGLIGIATSAQLWSSHAHWLNDAQEQEIVHDLGRRLLGGDIQQGRFSGPEEQALLERMRQESTPPEPAKNSYTVSLTPHSDQLSQWRAYCPDAGGFAVGFPGEHLKAVGKEQGFVLAPCIYDFGIATQVVAHIITHHRDNWASATDSKAETIDTAVLGLRDDLSTIAPLFKHFSFEEEAEWRLIGQVWINDDRIKHRASTRSIIPYVPIDLLTPAHPSVAPPEVTTPERTVGVVIGPRPDYSSTTSMVRSSGEQSAAGYAIQSLFTISALRPQWTTSSISPYRGSAT